MILFRLCHLEKLVIEEHLWCLRFSNLILLHFELSLNYFFVLLFDNLLYRVLLIIIDFANLINLRRRDPENWGSFWIAFFDYWRNVNSILSLNGDLFCYLIRVLGHQVQHLLGFLVACQIGEFLLKPKNLVLGLSLERLFTINQVGVDHCELFVLNILLQSITGVDVFVSEFAITYKVINQIAISLRLLIWFLEHDWMLGEMTGFDCRITQNWRSLPIFLDFTSMRGKIGPCFPLRVFNLLAEQVYSLLAGDYRLFLGVHCRDNLGFLQQDGILRSLLLGHQRTYLNFIGLFLKLLQLLTLFFDNFV